MNYELRITNYGFMLKTLAPASLIHNSYFTILLRVNLLQLTYPHG